MDPAFIDLLAFGRSLPWYEYPFVALALVIVFPEAVLNFLSQRTNRTFYTRHIVYLEAVAIISMGVWWLLLLPYYSVPWWFPPAMIAGVGIVRGIRTFISFLFPF